MVNYIPEFQGYSGQGAFRYWCQKVLPLVYDDSLSYYELLNKVVVYLNNTIEDVAKAEGNIDSLLTAYTSLKNDVDHYFDTLDVQEQINTKLDEMATDGSLSNLIEPFIPNLVTSWLTENVIIPEGGAVTLDPTLTSAVQAAQAKATGDAINEVADDLDVLSDKVIKYKLIDPSTLNSLAEFPVGYMCAGITFADTSWTDYPQDCSSGIVTCARISAAKKLQVIYEYTTSSTNITNFYWRVIDMNAPYTVLMNWQKLANVKDIESDMALALRSSQKYIQHSNLQGYTDANDFEANYMYEIASDVVATDIANLPEYGELAYIFTPTYDTTANYNMQIYINQYKIYTRIKRVGGWDVWTTNINYHPITPTNYNSVAELPYNFFCTITFSNTSWTDYPQGLLAGAFFSYKYAPNFKLQFIVQISQSAHNINRIWFRTVNVNTYEVYSDWMQMPNIDDVNSIIETNVIPNTIKYISSLRSYLTEINKTKLGDIKENAIVLYNKVVDREHPENNFSVPDSAFDSMILLNMRYSPNFNIQFAFTINCKEFKYRIVDRRDGSEYRTWKAPDSFDGKVCLAVGDSICLGSRNGGRGYLGNFGLTLNNLSRASACLSNIRVDPNDPKKDTFCIYRQFEIFANNLENFDYYPDIIISDGGINDYVFHSPLGTEPTVPVTTETEASALDKGTLTGGLQYLFYLWIKNYPKAQKYFLLTHKTYFPSSGRYAPTYVETMGYNQEQMNEVIRKICDIYGVEVIDVYGKSMINTKFPQYVSPVDINLDTNTSADVERITNTYFVDSDGVHPLELGYQQGYIPFVRQALKTSTKKELLNDYLYFEFDGSSDEDWRALATSPSGEYRMVCYNEDIPTYLQMGYSGTPTETMNAVKSNQFPEGWSINSSNNMHPYYKHETICLSNSNANHFIQLYSSTYQLVDAWRTHLSENPLKVIVRKPVYTD